MSRNEAVWVRRWRQYHHRLTVAVALRPEGTAEILKYSPTWAGLFSPLPSDFLKFPHQSFRSIRQSTRFLPLPLLILDAFMSLTFPQKPFVQRLYYLNVPNPERTLKWVQTLLAQFRLLSSSKWSNLPPTPVLRFGPFPSLSVWLMRKQSKINISYLPSRFRLWWKLLTSLGMFPIKGSPTW